MNKIYSCLLAFTALSVCTYGKTTGLSVPNIFPHFGSGAQNNAAGITQSRIIGQTYLRFDGITFVPVDSTTYSYSFGRGGYLSTEDLSDNFVSFDNSFTYLFNPALGTYRNQFYRIQEFNETNKTKRYTCKTWRVSDGTWRDSSRFLYTYNSDQTRLDSTIFQIFWGGSWLSHVVYKNLFDASNRVTDMNSNVYKMQFTYDASNNIVERIESILPIPMPWKDDSKHIFSYNTSNQMTTYIVQLFDGVWKNSKKYEYVYNGSDLNITTEYDWTNNAWTISGQHLFTYDNDHNKTSDIYQYWDVTTSSFVNDVRLQWTYNNFSQPLTYYSESWEPSTSAWTNMIDDFLYRYYYQSFTPMSVNRFVKGDIRMVLYPQPARQSVNVRVFLEKPEPYTIAIYDVQGRVVKQLSGTNINVEQNIPVYDLAAGPYFLKINTSDKQQTQQFAVVH